MACEILFEWWDLMFKVTHTHTGTHTHTNTHTHKTNMQCIKWNLRESSFVLLHFFVYECSDSFFFYNLVSFT
jgi:hypothetical protein